MFRPIRNGKPPKQPKSADPLDTLFPKPKSNTSYTTQLSEPSRQNSKQSNKSQLLNKRRITPNSLPTTAKVRMIFTSKQRSVREYSVGQNKQNIKQVGNKFVCSISFLYMLRFPNYNRSSA